MPKRLKEKLRSERKFGWQALNDAQYAAIVGILSGSYEIPSASNGQNGIRSREISSTSTGQNGIRSPGIPSTSSGSNEIRSPGIPPISNTPSGIRSPGIPPISNTTSAIRRREISSTFNDQTGIRNLGIPSTSNAQSGVYERLDEKFQVTGIPEGNLAAGLASNPCPGFLLWHRRLKKFALSWTMSLEIFWCFYENFLKEFQNVSSASVCAWQNSIIFAVKKKFLCRTDFLQKSFSLFSLILQKASNRKKISFVGARREFFWRFLQNSLEILKMAPMVDEEFDLFFDFQNGDGFGMYPAIPDKEYRALLYFLRIEFEAFQHGERARPLSIPEISALRNQIFFHEFEKDYKKYQKQFRSRFEKRVKSFRAWKIPDDHEMAQMRTVQPGRIAIVCTKSGRIMLSESQVEELTILYRQQGIPVGMYDPAALKLRKFVIVDALSLRYAGFSVGSLAKLRFAQTKPWNKIMENLSTIDFSSPAEIEIYKQKRFSGLEICIDPRPPMIPASLNENEIHDQINSRRWACERSVAINGQLATYRPLGPIFTFYVLDRDWLSLRARLATLATYLFTRRSFCFYVAVASKDFESFWRAMCQILLVENCIRPVGLDRFMSVFRFFQTIHHFDELERFADFSFLAPMAAKNFAEALRFFTTEVDLSLKSRMRSETETQIRAYQQLIEVFLRRQRGQTHLEQLEEADERAVAAFQTVFQRFPGSEAFLFPALELVSFAGPNDRIQELIATSKDVLENADLRLMLNVAKSKRRRRKNLLSLIDRNPWVPEVLQHVQTGLNDEANGRICETPIKLLERMIEYLSYAQNQNDRNGWKLAYKCLTKCSTNLTPTTVPKWWLKMFFGSNLILRKYQRKFLSSLDQLVSGQNNVSRNGIEVLVKMEVDQSDGENQIISICTDTTIEMEFDE